MLHLFYEKHHNTWPNTTQKRSGWFSPRFHLMKSQRIINIVKSTSNRISSRGHIDTERSRMAYGHAEPTPLCLCGPIRDTTGVSIWQAFNQSNMSAPHKHWINIDAFQFHSLQCTATVKCKHSEIVESSRDKAGGKKKHFCITFVSIT